MGTSGGIACGSSALHGLAGNRSEQNADIGEADATATKKRGQVQFLLSLPKTRSELDPVS
jgi:hypothetical protein